MAALTGPRISPAVTIRFKILPLAGSVKAYRGGNCAADISSGCVRPYVASNANLITIGQFADDVDNSASTGTSYVNVELAREIECVWYDNATGANAIVASKLFTNVYGQDDHTVTLASGTTSTFVGRVWDVDSLQGVLVQPNQF